MGFYYYSFLSIVPLGIAYGLLALIYWGVTRATRGAPKRKLILVTVGALFVLLPISEELWIAWSFGQACKEAGTFINKKVQVDGFYDDTAHWWRQLKESSNYRFVESRDNSSGTIWRVEREGDDVRHFKIDRPTARYHFRYSDPMNGTPWAHKIVRSGSVVVDGESNNEIARYTSFGRRPPWFFIGLDAPAFACDAPGRWPLTKGSRIIYPEVLIPTAQR